MLWGSENLLRGIMAALSGDQADVFKDGRALKHVAGNSGVRFNAIGTTAVTLVAPASNTNGLIVRSVAMLCTSGTLGLCFGNGAPTTVSQTDKAWLAWASATVRGVEKLPLPLKIASGFGLYAVGTASDLTNMVSASFDLL